MATAPYAPGCGWTPLNPPAQVCVARDGRISEDLVRGINSFGLCRGCGKHPADLLAQLSREVTGGRYWNSMGNQ